ncbi:hypothetical protein FOL46_009904 [Perkinsus olseni]|uniref:Uncharacterized protein n=1 Tax=Perkinsus olseni TaxID=32597 RepID=A0A7J6KYW6_PEROL|nr:hypothetical protein FOL46_009904 [Perkinsus olseni]
MSAVIFSVVSDDLPRSSCCPTGPQETDLSALRQRLLDLEMDVLALRRSSREYVTFDALQKELDEVHRRVRLSSMVTRETPTTPGRFISPDDPIYKSMMARLEELEHTTMRRSDTVIAGGRMLVKHDDDKERLALERRVSDLQRVVKLMQREEARRQDNLEIRIRQLEGLVEEMLREGKNKETFLLDSFEALRDGISSSLLPFLDAFKLDITRHLEGTQKSEAEGLRREVADAVITEHRRVDGMIDEMVSKVDARIKQTAASLREGFQAAIVDEVAQKMTRLDGSVCHLPKEVVSVGVGREDGSGRVGVWRLLGSTVADNESPTRQTLEVQDDVKSMERDDAVRQPLTEGDSKSDGSSAEASPDALLDELGGDPWDGDED